MAKYKVLKDFNDKNTEKFHAAGTEYTTNMERGKKLVSMGFLEEVEEKKTSKEASKKSTDSKEEVNDDENK